MRGLLRRALDFINRKNVILVMGAVLCVVCALVALFAPLLEAHDPLYMDMSQQFLPPSGEYPLGTDNLGRCILCRIIEGTRISLVTACCVVVFSAVIGTIVGLVSGLAGGAVDTILMRIVDVFLAFPTIIFALAVSAILGSSQMNLIIALSCVMWTRFARVTRGEAVLLKNEEFIEAARAIGNSTGAILVRYLLPNVASKVIVLVSLDVGSVILFCSSLSFLGLGAQPPTPDWGAMISEGKDYLRFSPWMSLFPGLAIAVSAIAFNLLGDGLRDRIDPRMRELIKAE